MSEKGSLAAIYSLTKEIGYLCPHLEELEKHGDTGPDQLRFLVLKGASLSYLDEMWSYHIVTEVLEAFLRLYSKLLINAFHQLYVFFQGESEDRVDIFADFLIRDLYVKVFLFDDSLLDQDFDVGLLVLCSWFLLKVIISFEAWQLLQVYL